MKLQLTITIDESQLAKVWQPKYIKKLLKFNKKDINWWGKEWLLHGFPNGEKVLKPYMNVDIKEVNNENN